MNVLGIGEIVLDKICVLNALPLEGEKIDVLKTEFSTGGPTVAALILLSRLGCQCKMIGSIGNDQAGQIITQKLTKEKIEFLPVIQDKTKINTVLVNQKKCSRTIVKDSSNNIPIKNIDPALIERADLIVLDRHEPLAASEVMKRKRPKTQVVFDPSTEISQKTMRIFNDLDYIILPIESLNKISLKRLLSTFHKTVIVTANELGSAIYVGKKVKLAPAFKVHAIDPVGAGDVFRGAFGYGLLKHWNIEKTVDFANLVAGLQCTRFGNGSAVPTKNEILNFQKIAKHKKVNLLKINKLLI